MALEQSILKSTKKKLGLNDAYDEFDTDVIDHINGTFFRLKTLGLGPPQGFMIEDDDALWAHFVIDGLDLTVVNAVKSYIYLKVRLLFDPPGTAHHVSMIKDQIQELEHVLLTERDLQHWNYPSLPE